MKEKLLENRKAKIYDLKGPGIRLIKIPCQNINDYLKNSEELEKKIRKSGKRWFELHKFVFVQFGLENLVIRDIEDFTYMKDTSFMCAYPPMFIPDKEEILRKYYVLSDGENTTEAYLEIPEIVWPRMLDSASQENALNSRIGDRVNIFLSYYSEQEEPIPKIYEFVNYSLM